MQKTAFKIDAPPGAARAEHAEKQLSKFNAPGADRAENADNLFQH